MPSLEVYSKLLSQGYRVDLHPYERYDSLASEQDIQSLFEILIKHKDRSGKHPIVTSNFVMANPDFKRIRDSDFTEYHYELFPDTLNRYGYKQSFQLWKQGINEGLLLPQFHGREHINVALWMNALRQNDQDTMVAFNFGMTGIFPKSNHLRGNKMMVALNDNGFESSANLDYILKDGLTLFEGVFGFQSRTFMAPVFTWRPEIERTLAVNGIQGIQGAFRQIVPHGKSISHTLGSRSRDGLYYLTRNCSFEPATNNSTVSQCMHEIEKAFYWRKPAVISSHRINYIGSIHTENREKNLTQLNILLAKILGKWPDVEFFSSVDLLDLVMETDHLK